MKKKITIDSSGTKLEMQAEFFDNPAARKVLDFLPINSKVKLWGEEIYFDTGIEAPDEGATTEVNIGDLAYWPQGQSICIFFGKTPASTNDKPVPASEVVVIGKVSLEKDKLLKVKSDSIVRIE